MSESVSAWQQVAGAFVIAAGIYMVVRRIDVRFALLITALALGVVAWQVDVIFATFAETLSNPGFVVPLCTAMGFGYTLKATGCDRHLVHLLVHPLRYCRPLLIPGSVVVGFITNIAIISQTSCAAAVGPVLLPLLRSARISTLTAGAALLLGVSVGGDLLNPGTLTATTVSSMVGVRPQDVVAHTLPLSLVVLGVAVAVFWFLALRAEKAAPPEEVEELEKGFRINPFKALIPLLPLVLLFTGEGRIFGLVPVDDDTPWRPVGYAMMIGTLCAWAAVGREAPKHSRAFFEGAGFAFAQVIMIIVAAFSFAKGLELLGYFELAAEAARQSAGLAQAGAMLLTWALAILSGSGSAPTMAIIPVVVPLGDTVPEQIRLGVLAAHGGELGRTMSPVAAVVIFTSTLVGATPFQLLRRVAPALLAAGFTMLLLVLLGALPPLPVPEVPPGGP